MESKLHIITTVTENCLIWHYHVDGSIQQKAREEHVPEALGADHLTWIDILPKFMVRPDSNALCRNAQIHRLEFICHACVAIAV